MELAKEEEWSKVYISPSTIEEKAEAFDHIMERVLSLECYDGEMACQTDRFIIDITYIMANILDEYVIVEYLE